MEVANAICSILRGGDVSWELHSRNKGGFFEAPGSGESGTEWEVIGWTGGRKRFITEKGNAHV